jgi:hypothetical protein
MAGVRPRRWPPWRDDPRRAVRGAFDGFGHIAPFRLRLTLGSLERRPNATVSPRRRERAIVRNARSRKAVAVSVIDPAPIQYAQSGIIDE